MKNTGVLKEKELGVRIILYENLKIAPVFTSLESGDVFSGISHSQSHFAEYSSTLKLVLMKGADLALLATEAPYSSTYHGYTQGAAL